MKPVFVDTSGLIAIGNTRDAFHQSATELLRDLVAEKRRFITTNAVVIEFANAFSRAESKRLAIRVLDLLEKSDSWKVLIVDALLMKKSVERFKQMHDKNWSLVDCISMIVATDEGSTEVFTNDHHFEQAGFKILLK